MVIAITHIQCSSGVVDRYSFRTIQLSLSSPLCTETLDKLATASVHCHTIWLRSVMYTVLVESTLIPSG